MLVCKNCGAKIADHSKKCYACHVEVTPETAEEFHREGAEEEVNPFTAARVELEKHGANAKNIWQERYGAGKENPEQLEKGDPRIPKDPFDISQWPEETDEDLKRLKEAIFRLDEFTKKSATEPSDEMRYVGDNAFGYIMKFHRIEEGKQLVSWNWWAFIIGPLWFMYRKMYALGVGLTFLNIWISLYFGTSVYFYIITIIIDVLMGLFADGIYYNHIQRLIERGKDLDKEKKEKHIKRFGGTSLWGALGIGMAFQILTYVIYYIL